MLRLRFPWQPGNTTPPESEPTAFLELAYELVLGRKADKEGLKSYLKRLRAGRLSAAGVLREMRASKEYQRARGGFHLAGTEQLQWYREQRDPLLEADLRRCDFLPAGDFDRVWTELFEQERELVIGQAEYAAVHRDRFREHFNGVGRLLSEHRQPRLLEFGVSEFSGFYLRLWPDLHFEVADRPSAPDYPGFTRQRSLAVSGAAAFHEVNLEQPGSLYAGDLERGSFDVVVLAEVLEHLVVNPVELLEALITLLSPAGVLYLTTPNFLRRENLRMLEAVLNPQQVFPAADGNWDAHFHHREYAAREMLDFIRTAGGRCRSFHFSDCWEEASPEPGPEHESGNLVFVISRRTFG